MRCDGQCTNVLSTIENCGGCGLRCNLANATAVCMAGGCRVQACRAGYRDCDSVASNGCEQGVLSDSNNCGACGNACTNGRFCSGGTCNCPGGFTFCTAANACLNLQSDSNNCGACGIVCSGGASCQMGVCRCPTGQTRCDSTCVNASNDRNNCGVCGNVCPTGQNCSTIGGMTACR